MTTLKVILFFVLGILFATYGIAYLVALHKALVRKNVVCYRWVIESLLFRRQIKYIKNMTSEERVDLYLNLDANPRWFQKYWFGKKLMRILGEEIEKDNK